MKCKDTKKNNTKHKKMKKNEKYFFLRSNFPDMSIACGLKWNGKNMPIVEKYSFFFVPLGTLEK